MEKKDRSVWIVVGIVAAVGVLLVACLAGCLAVAAGLGLFVNRTAALSDGQAPFQDRMERSFEVGAAPEVTVDSFAGKVTVRAGQPGMVDVVVIKRASRAKDLGGTGIDMNETATGGLQIKSGSSPLASNVSVDLDLTVPPDTPLKIDLGAGEVLVEGLQAPVQVDLGAGNIQVRDVRGPIEARTGAGNAEARGVQGPARLEVQVGNVLYEGVPLGDCEFRSKVGAIGLELPADPDVRVDLDANAGVIEVQCSVEGVVKPRQVQGVIGDGARGSLRAETSAGGIGLICR